jgi:CheY-like chemotaxis protein
VPNVLIVDDDTDLLHGQRLFLEGRGFTVRVAASMEDGLRILEAFLPDIILADLMMEQYDTGVVFCKKVRDNPKTASVPIVMQTGASRLTGFHFDAEDPATRRWLMVDEVITKPVPLDELLKKIEKWLGGNSRDG